MLGNINIIPILYQQLSKYQQKKIRKQNHKMALAAYSLISAPTFSPLSRLGACLGHHDPLPSLRLVDPKSKGSWSIHSLGCFNFRQAYQRVEVTFWAFLYFSLCLFEKSLWVMSLAPTPFILYAVTGGRIRKGTDWWGLEVYTASSCFSLTSL